MLIASEEELTFLKKHCRTVSAKALAALLGWPVKKVYNHAFALGLAKKQRVVTPEMVPEIKKSCATANYETVALIHNISPGVTKKIRTGTYSPRKRWFE